MTPPPLDGAPPADTTAVQEATLTYRLPAPVAKYLKATHAGNLGGWGTPPTRFAFAGWHDGPGGFRANQLSVVDLVGDSAVVRWTGADLSDPRWSEIRIFLDGARTLLLADAEDEYSMGLQAFDVDSMGRLTDLKLSWVALPDTAGAMGPSASALAAASVSVDAGRWVIAFDQDLIVDPGSREQHLLCRVDPAHPITLLQSPSGWETKNAGPQDAGPPMGPLRTCDRR